MKSGSSFITRGLCTVTIAFVLAILFVAPYRAPAQEGYNAICATSTCSVVGTSILPSSAFTDASAFCSVPGKCTSSDDFCGVVNTALASHSFPAGVVIDARGVMPQPPSVQKISCASSPLFASFSNPSTILLPAGVITIKGKWVLPDRTRLIGQGNNPNAGTSISVPSSGYTDLDMIEMGSSTCNDSGTGQCFGISIEGIYLLGGGTTNPYPTLIGILNRYAGPSSYVDHVNFAYVGGTGLVIGSNATDSGPYSNLAMSPAATCVKANDTACVHVGDGTYGIPASTRGIHGLTCTCTGAGTSGGSAPAGIALNSPNNTLEDIHFEGFIDGIQVGGLSSGTISTQGNVLMNVNGGNNAVDSMTNLIHICSPSTCGNLSNTVSDVVIKQVYATPYSGSAPIAIKDDLTGPTIIGAGGLTTVGMYVLGDPMGTGGYSRYATPPALPTWSASNVPATTGTTCASGSLFSNTAGVAGGTGGNYTLWVCKSGAWKAVPH
jgi:hypothetical protein